MIRLKRSLGYIYYSLICFLIQIYSNINNLKEIRLLDSFKQIQISKNLILFLLIIVSLTLIFSTISNLLNLFIYSIEDYSIDHYQTNHSIQIFPFLTFCDLFISILILLPKLIINTQFIQFNLKDQSLFIFDLF